MSNELSTAMRIAIRAIADGDPKGIHGRTMKSLRDRGIVRNDPPELTTYGNRLHGEIMSSGDGPEDLKARLTFGRPRRR